MTASVKESLFKNPAKITTGTPKQAPASQPAQNVQNNGNATATASNPAKYFTTNQDVINNYTNDKKDLGAEDAFRNAVGSSIFGDSLKHDYNSLYCQTVQGIHQVAKGERPDFNVRNEETGEMEQKDLAEVIAESYDSELDLYVEEQFEKFVKECGICSYWWANDGVGFMTPENLKVLKDKYHLEIMQLDDRTYTISMIDDNGNIIKDANDKNASIVFSDAVIPDGCAQGAEFNLSSMLDQMGYECISQADYIGHEDAFNDTMSAIENELNKVWNGQTSEYISVSDITAQEYVQNKFDNASNDLQRRKYRAGYYGSSETVALKHSGGTPEGFSSDEEFASELEKAINDEKLTSEEEKAKEAKEKDKAEKGKEQEEIEEKQEQNTVKLNQEQIKEAKEEYEKIFEEKMKEYQKESNGKEPDKYELKHMKEDVLKQVAKEFDINEKEIDV